MTEDERRAIEADCERLIKHYVVLNDAQQWDALAALYTEDGRFARPTTPISAIDLFKAHSPDLAERTPPAHHRPLLERF